MAAETGTGQSMYSASRYYETNCIGTSNIIDVIVNFKTNISKFILASSRSVYGEGDISARNAMMYIIRNKDLQLK